MLRANAERLGQALHAERERGRAMRDMAERERLALRLLAGRLASLHACIMETPDGGCVDVDVADCRKGCASCWAVWAETEAGRLRERRRQRAGERRRPEPLPADLAGYVERYGAE